MYGHCCQVFSKILFELFVNCDIIILKAGDIMEDKKTERIEFRVTKEFLDNVLKRAEEENRTMSNFITTIILNYLNDIEKAKKLLK